jgi:RNA polymerase sigma-B factor
MSGARITTRRAGPAHVLTVEGVLDFAASLRLRLALYEGVDAGCRDLVVDLTRVRLLDASAVGVLLRVAENVQERGGSLRAVGGTGLVLEVLEVTGAAKSLGAYEPPDTVLAGLDEVDATSAPQEANSAQWRNPWGFEVTEMLHAMSQLAPDDRRRTELRQRAIEVCLPHTERLARRFYGMGESPADLTQVAALGLLKAIDGYDPGVGTDFGAYALPTVLGELKRYFRDRGWGVHVPRRLQELRLEINRARDELTQRLGRSPTIPDLATHLGLDEEQVVEAMVAATGYRPSSLYAPTGQEDGLTPLDRLGANDAEIDTVDLRESVRPLLAQLPTREKRIISMRFFGNMTQSQIATELGISQMHVSRLLNRTLAKLRSALLAEC